MKNIKSYQEFSEQNEGFKDVALGTALAASTIMPSFGKDKVQDRESRVSISTNYEQRKDVYIKDGFRLDSVSMVPIYDKIRIESPDTIIKDYSIILEDISYSSGSYNLNKEQKDALFMYIDSLESEGNILLKVTITSTTDKTPVGPNLIKIGIKSNKDLSQKRNDGVKQFLMSFGIDVELIEQDVRYEEGGENDPSTRRVLITFSCVKDKGVKYKYADTEVIKDYKKVYHLSRGIRVGDHKFKTGKVVNNTVKNVPNVKSIKCSKIAKDVLYK